MLLLHLLQLPLQRLILLNLLLVLVIDSIKVVDYSCMLSFHRLHLGFPCITFVVLLLFQDLTVCFNPLFLKFEHLNFVFPVLLFNVAELDLVFDVSDLTGALSILCWWRWLVEG